MGKYLIYYSFICRGGLPVEGAAVVREAVDAERDEIHACEDADGVHADGADTAGVNGEGVNADGARGWVQGVPTWTGVQMQVCAVDGARAR